MSSTWMGLVAQGCSVHGCELKAHGHGLCSKHYNRIRRHGTLAVSKVIGDDKTRLISNADINPNGCWEWKKSKYNGYGKTRLSGALMAAHRAAWIVFVGNIPDGMQINHKCHNRACINPEHLYVGTQKDNMRDMSEAGREYHPVGELSATSKLTEEQVIEIRGSLDSAKVLSGKFGVSLSLIRAVRSRIIWKHIP